MGLMVAHFLRVVLCVVAVVGTACGPTAPSCPQVDPLVTLPADDRLHRESTEWWYWTGHLADEMGRKFGFQMTFFVFAIGESQAVLSNVALTDIEGQEFHHKAAFSFASPTTVRDGFKFELGPGAAEGGNGNDWLKADLPDAGFELTLTPGKVPTLQHGDGREDYSIGGYTYYYSRTRMPASGSVTIDGLPRKVNGQAWFDHQWGDLQALQEHGWDWFALQLDDGRDVMLFLVHAADGSSLVGGTVTDASGCAKELKPDEVHVTAKNTWTSPVSGCTYPQGWQVELPGLSLEVTPVMANQELYTARDRTKTYWEGASVVTGTVGGKGYVELTGYCSPSP